MAENGRLTLPKPSSSKTLRRARVATGDPAHELAPESASVESVADAAAHEVVQPGTRRRFSAADKLHLVKTADAAIATGRRGALETMLRSEGIYSSQLSSWRRQLLGGGVGGLTPRTPGRKPKLDAHARELLALTKELEAVKHKLRVANAIIGLQKKAHEVLGLALPELPEVES